MLGPMLGLRDLRQLKDGQVGPMKKIIHNIPQRLINITYGSAV